MLPSVWGHVAPLVGASPDSPPRVLCVDASRGIVDGTCLLMFRGNERAPCVAVKLARNLQGRAVFQQEMQTLAELVAGGLNENRMTVPEPLGSWEIAGYLCTAQRALDGVLMKNMPGRRLVGGTRREATILTVVDWWRDLQRCCPPRVRQMDEVLYRSEVLGPVDAFARRFLLSAAEAEFLESRFRARRRLLGLELPFMVRHGDFCTANVMIGSQGVGVFDWEFPLEPQLPMFDLFFYLSSLRFPYRGLRGESSHFDSFQEIFWGQLPLSRQLRSLLRVEAETQGVPAQALPDLFILALLQTASLKVEARLEALALRDPTQTTASDETRRELWRRLEMPAKNVPFSFLRDGRLANLQVLVERGPPDFGS